MAMRSSLLALVVLAACSVGESAVVTGLGGELDPAEALRQDGVQDGADLVAKVEVDAQIDDTAATIAVELHRAEAVIGAPAAERAPDFDVHELAERAIRTHKAASAELGVLRAERDIALRETSVSMALRVEADDEADALATMPADKLDLAYTERQIRGSARAGEMFRRLANRVEDAPLRGFFDRQVVAAEEQVGRAIHVYEELLERP
jgi:hypothetical protein